MNRTETHGLCQDKAGEGEKNGGVFTSLGGERREIGQGGSSTNQSGQEINDGLEMTEIPASFFKARFPVIRLQEGWGRRCENV